MGSSSSALKICTDHRGGINWISLSPDGQWLLTGSEDGTARLWSTANNQCQTHFQGHESYITFCHLENEVAFTCSADHTIRKWDVMTGRCLAIYRGHTSIVNRILVSKDYLFSGSYDRTARCWSVDKEKPIQEFRGHRNCVLALALYSSKDVLEEEEMEEEIEEVEELSQDFLVTGSTDCTVKVWWVSTGRCHQTLLGHTGAVLCLILDAPNRELFSGSTDYTIRTWNIVTGEQLRVFKEHQGSIICLEPGPHSQAHPRPDTCLASRLQHQHITQPSGPLRLQEVDQQPWGLLLHMAAGAATARHVSGGGGPNCGSSEDAWLLRVTAALLDFTKEPGVIFSMFTGSGDTCARAFNTKTGILQRVFRGHKLVINCIQIHNELLYTASHDGTLRIWDIRQICKRSKCRLKERSIQGRHFHKGSLPRLFNNKVGCVLHQENGGPRETMELE
ncbi:WD repeat-containing protein 86 [Pseudonaja textilis]|uniref:WD repeat-containing protein 86 n=1 Tax=Pseudonaja textilis TaxID=8673 RepID=UPI000EA8C86E|nr:WD repeat-containing protein 86 [Pseudonaja textilis]